MSASTVDLQIPVATNELVIIDRRDSEEDDTQNNRIICYRDPADVRTIHRQSRLILLAFIITAVAIVGVVYKSIQRPDRIVVDMSSGRTVMINDREFGATESVKLEKDKLQLADMDYVVKAFVDYLYRVDQRSRSKDIEAALRLMVPGQAKKFAQYLTEQKILQTQREEQWNASWKPEYLEHAPGKPLTVKVYGTQEIDMVVKNESKHATKHILLTVELLPDAPENGTFRLDRNLRSGFRINSVDYKELGSSEAETAVVASTQE
ncbi:MAG TPA: hypothetical protein VE863_01635 [Pyrinomonadaceae bacterium]|jgi:hypothetical protein|nr:hypothetical protein [Pyrinomonadaceae bacterium]